MKGGDVHMNEKQLFPLALYLANESRERERRAAASARRIPSQPRPSIRWAVGQSFVRLGERLAGETPFEPVRSR
jgi:hypothetical protein